MTTVQMQPQGSGGPLEVAGLIREVNDSNEAAEDQCLRARQAADVAARSAGAAAAAATAASAARMGHQIIQQERPRRRAPRVRQIGLALVTIALDGVACYFAAQALNGDRDATLVWTALFLAVLAGGEAGLDYYRDRSRRAWLILAGVLGTFLVLLGVLRFWFLATIGTGGLVPASTGAGLFTAATGAFLFLGYRALRAAETPAAARARRAARVACRAAQAAAEVARRDTDERDRLIDAYLCQVRRVLQRTCPSGEQLDLEAAVRSHLCGKAAPS